MENHVVGWPLRNIGSWAVSVSGVKSGVVVCDISETGDGGIRISGGDRNTLTSAGSLRREQSHPPLEPVEPDESARDCDRRGWQSRRSQLAPRFATFGDSFQQ